MVGEPPLRLRVGLQLVPINQFGHPYQGNLYFNAGRANGLSFWESAPLAALGSATWEYFGEKNHASINDFVTTTMGGIALGEMFHRAGWLIRDASRAGGKRRRSEILAMVVDPITGVNRFMSGDASRVSENPPDSSRRPRSATSRWACSGTASRTSAP